MRTRPVLVKSTPCPMRASAPMVNSAQSSSARPIRAPGSIRKPNSARRRERFRSPGSSARTASVVSRTKRRVLRNVAPRRPKSEVENADHRRDVDADEQGANHRVGAERNAADRLDDFRPATYGQACARDECHERNEQKTPVNDSSQHQDD